LNIENLIILTGNHLVKEKFTENGLPTDYPVLTKPIDFEDLLSVLKKEALTN
jgi:hypothetical protein